MKKSLLSAILVFVLLLSIAVPSVLAQQGPVTGSFTTANLAPTVTALEVYTDAGLGTVANSLTPQVTYFVRVTASDNNTVDDIAEIEVRLFYDAAGANPDPAPVAPDTQANAILLWDKDGLVNEWTISAGAPTSWAVVPGSSTIPADMTASSGDWVFAVTVGKVATESPAGANWDLWTEARDASASASPSWFTRDKAMVWYGEISTVATANFGTVSPGSGFADGTNEVNGISVTYISNGNYDQQIMSDAAWTGATYTANYDITGATVNPQEFSLMGWDADVWANRVQLLTAAGVSIDATGIQTGETGWTVATNTVWLKVASVFAGDTYSGNITYIVANR